MRWFVFNQGGYFQRRIKSQYSDIQLFSASLLVILNLSVTYFRSLLYVCTKKLYLNTKVLELTSVELEK